MYLIIATIDDMPEILPFPDLCTARAFAEDLDTENTEYRIAEVLYDSQRKAA